MTIQYQTMLWEKYNKIYLLLCNKCYKTISSFDRKIIKSLCYLAASQILGTSTFVIVYVRSVFTLKTGQCGQNAGGKTKLFGAGQRPRNTEKVYPECTVMASLIIQSKTLPTRARDQNFNKERGMLLCRFVFATAISQVAAAEGDTNTKIGGQT